MKYSKSILLVSVKSIHFSYNVKFMDVFVLAWSFIRLFPVFYLFLSMSLATEEITASWMFWSNYYFESYFDNLRWMVCSLPDLIKAY